MNRTPDQSPGWWEPTPAAVFTIGIEGLTHPEDANRLAASLRQLAPILRQRGQGLLSASHIAVADGLEDWAETVERATDQLTAAPPPQHQPRADLP